MATGTSTASPGRRDAGTDERERAAERHGERAVGAGPVADHQQLDRRRRRRASSPTAAAIGAYGLPATTGRRPAAVLHGGEDRPAAGDRSVRRRVRGVVVRADQAGAARAPRSRRCASARSRTRGGSRPRRRRHRHRAGSSPATGTAPRASDRLGDARPAAHEHPLARRRRAPPRRSPTSARRRRPGCRCAASAASWSPRRAPELLVTNTHPTARRPQPGDRLDRAGDRLVGQPDHPVEVAEHGSGVHRRMSGGRTGAEWRGAPLRTVPRRPLRARRRPRRRGRPAVRRAVGRRRRRAGGPRPAQHRPRRRAPGRRRTATRRRGATLRRVARRRACWSPTTARRSRSTACASPTPPASPATSSACSAGWRSSTRAPAACCPTSARRPKASTDRLDLTRATTANLSPVWGLSLAAGLTALLAEAGRAGRRRHRRRRRARRRAGRPTPTASPPSREHLGRDDVLIADGHHRYGISRTYRDEVRAAAGRRRHGRRADARLRRRARRRAAEHRGDPPAVHAASPFDDAARRAGPLVRARAGRRADARDAGRRWRPSGRLVLVAPDGSAEWLTPAARRVRRRPRRSTARGSSTPWPAAPAEVTYQHGLDEVVAAVTRRRGRRRPC